MLEYHPAPWDQWVNVGDIVVARDNHAVLSFGPQQLTCSGDVTGHQFFVLTVLYLQSSSSTFSAPPTLSLAYHQNQNIIGPQGVTLNTIAAKTSITNSGQCPALPPSPGNLCVPPAGNQVCLYNGGQGGTSKDSPLIVTCCCGRCPEDVTCAPDSITGSGLWQSIAYSPLCPTEGCGTDGK